MLLKMFNVILMKIPFSVGLYSLTRNSKEGKV